MSRYAVVTAFPFFVVAGFVYTACAQPPVPIPEPPHTLGRFLGIPQTVTGAYDSLVNRRGNFPGLERKGPGARLKRIADPAFLDPAAPPLLKTAAQIKMQEDLAPQKIKALKYLASIGCGCYDKDGEVTAAILEGLNDCTEEVRAAAVETISEAASGEYCQFCSQRSCCKPALAEKLDELANAQDDKGCWLEPSERVRAAAAQALAACGPIIVETRPLDVETIGPEDLPTTPGVNGPPPVPMGPAASAQPLPTTAQRRSSPAHSSRRQPSPAATVSRSSLPPETRPAEVTAPPRRVAETMPVSTRLAYATDDSEDLFQLFQPEPAAGNVRATTGRGQAAPQGQPLQPIAASASWDGAQSHAPLADAQAVEGRGNLPVRPLMREGVVESVDAARGAVLVRFDHQGHVPPGTPVSIVHSTLLGGLKVSGRVDRWDSGLASVRPFDEHLVSRLSRGDKATLYVPRTPAR